MDSIFQAKTQYDTAYHYDSKKACSIFSLLSAYLYMSSMDFSKDTHESNVETAIDKCKQLKIINELAFDDLLSYSTINPGSLFVTNIHDMAANKGKALFDIVRNIEICSIIVLKNARYFVILKMFDMYHVRDCHEIFQYTFYDEAELYEHLNTVYQIGKPVYDHGAHIEEYDQIEYVVIDNPFNVLFMNPVDKPAQVSTHAPVSQSVAQPAPMVAPQPTTSPSANYMISATDIECATAEPITKTAAETKQSGEYVDDYFDFN